MRFVRGNVRDRIDRPRTCVATLKSVAAAEKSKNQLSRDFRCRSIFDFATVSATSSHSITTHSATSK